MTAQSAALLYSADSFMTEVHAAALIVAIAALSWTTATTRRPLYAALLGLALAALVLTPGTSSAGSASAAVIARGRRRGPDAAAKCSDTRANAVSGFSLACSPREHRSEGQREIL